MVILWEGQKMRALRKFSPEHGSLKRRHPLEEILYPPLINIIQMHKGIRTYKRFNT